MNYFTPAYRVVLNKNLLVYPQFIDFLKNEFHRLIVNRLVQGTVNLEDKYVFTVTSIPLQWGTVAMNKIRSVESLPEDKVDPKIKRIAEILRSLDPLDPQPVDIDFTLGQIVSFVNKNVVHFKELVPGGVIDYFGIPTQLWFDDFPISTGTVLRAVDFGTLDNKPLHLFDAAFAELRVNLLDLFAQFMKIGSDLGEDSEGVTVKNVDI